MGLRGFLKGKLEKHGGITGLARAALARPAPVGAGADAAGSQPLPTAPDADGYVAVARSAQVEAGRPGQFEAHGQTIAVFRVDGALFAIDNACLHEDGPLGEAAQDGAIATCPYHDWQYDVRDGRCLTEPGRRLGCWRVRERDEIVWIGPARSRSSDERGGDHADGLTTV